MFSTTIDWASVNWNIIYPETLLNRQKKARGYGVCGLGVPTS